MSRGNDVFADTLRTSAAGRESRLIIDSDAHESLLGHTTLPRHPRRRRRGRPAPHARFACAEPGGKFICWLRAHIIDVSDVVSRQFTPPSRVPASSRCTSARTSFRIFWISEGIQHTISDISDTETFTMVSYACSHREGQAKRVIFPEDRRVGQAREETSHVCRGFVTGLVLGLNEHPVHCRKAH